MKYICTIGDENKEEIFLFPNMVDHDAMAEVIGRIKNQTHGNWHRVMRTPISAGFVGVLKGEQICYGKSISLGLDSREDEDTKILASQGG